MAGEIVPTVRMEIGRELPMPAQRASAYLTTVLNQRKVRVVAAGDEAALVIVIGLPGQNDALASRLDALKLTVAQPAESLLIAVNPGEIIVSGRDARGLAYGVYEVAEAMRLAPPGADLAAVVQSQSESPHLPVRAVQTQIFNEDVEKGWYESEDYWHWFFGMLARNRFNSYTLTFGHSTNYMVPPYPWMFEVPEYPDVRVKGLSDEQRAKNLANFQMIARTAEAYGVDLTVGLWTQLPAKTAFDKISYGDSPVENVPSGEAGGDYAAKGLRKLLQLSPGVTGVQFRMNLESGIPHDKQESYYQEQFAAIAGAGRPIKLDLRYKSLSQQTIDLAKQAGLDLTVSTKYWCEHMGLPYHPTAQDPAYSASRYGYGRLLKHPRDYRVTYQLWTVGSSRLLLWGDPIYAARFARSCTLGDADGFEVFAPLTNKGYGNDPGEWRIFADKSLEHYTWEYERYWAWFLAFGRWGYNPDTSDDVWRREMTSRFGPAAVDLDTAYRHASQVLPLITASTLSSAANWRFWPEMLPTMHLDAYRAIQPSDYGQFYAIAPFASRPANLWRAEDWAGRHSAFVEDAIADNVNPKWTAIQVSRRLDELANTTLAAVDAAIARATDPTDAELKATAMDLRVLAHLARYHAAKKRAATDLEFFRLTSDTQRLTLVWHHIRQAQAAWKRIVELTDGMYHDRLVMGFSQQHYADYPNKLHDHSRHWKDWQAEVDQDVTYVAELLKKHGVRPDADLAEVERALKRYPGETPLASPPVIQHEPVLTATPGHAVRITAQVSSALPLREVSIHYREMDQTKQWRRMPMNATADGIYVAQIPGHEVAAQYDIIYYVVARVQGGGTFWPDWQQEQPYIVVSVLR